MFAAIVGIGRSTLAPMSDAEDEYEKEYVLLNLIDTAAAGLYVVEVQCKTVLFHADADGTEGDDDEVELRFNVSNRNVDTNKGRKLQLSARTQGLWLFYAHNLEQIDDEFCNDFVVQHGIDKMCKVKLHQADATLLDARKFRTLAGSEEVPKKYLSFSAGGSSKVRSGQSRAQAPISGSNVSTHAAPVTVKDLGEVCLAICSMQNSQPALHTSCMWLVIVLLCRKVAALCFSMQLLLIRCMC